MFFIVPSLQAITISGIVRDNTGKYLKRVKVELKCYKIITHTDKNGFYQFKLDEKKFLSDKESKLFFYLKGYFKETVNIDLKKSSHIYNLVLVKVKKISEKLTVTALNRFETKLKIPMAESVVSGASICENGVENIVSGILNTPGVNFIGKGGYSITPSIRGLARRRVLMLIDGFRISGDRSAGTSASFIIPEMVKSIEVVRSSSSVFYGSDAIGGVINIHSRSSFEQNGVNKYNSANLSVNSINNRLNGGVKLGLSFGKYRLYTGFQYINAQDYSAKDIIVNNSGFKGFSGIIDFSYSDKNRKIYLGYVGGEGSMGKPDRRNDQNITSSVIKDTNHFIRFGLDDFSLIKNTVFHFSAVINPTIYRLKKINSYISKIDSADTTGLNYGFKTFISSNISQKIQLQAGIENFFRDNIRTENDTNVNDVHNKSTPIEDGYRSDIAPFFSLSYQINGSFNIEAGGRYTFCSMSAISNNTFKNTDTNAPAFFLGLNKKIGKFASIFINIGTAFRTPSLSELFYSGITGRRTVEGNSLLVPEKSFNIDGGIKFYKDSNYFGLYTFSYRVKNLIERFRNDEGVYTYDNLDTGIICGGEVEFGLSFNEYIELKGNYIRYIGRSIYNEIPLNDIPSQRIFLKLIINKQQLKIILSLLHSFDKADPGPAEINNNSYNLLNFNSIWHVSKRLNIYFRVLNVLNTKYYANADPDIPLAKGLDIALGMQLLF